MSRFMCSDAYMYIKYISYLSFQRRPLLRLRATPPSASASVANKCAKSIKYVYRGVVHRNWQTIDHLDHDRDHDHDHVLLIQYKAFWWWRNASYILHYKPCRCSPNRLIHKYMSIMYDVHSFITEPQQRTRRYTTEVFRERKKWDK